MKRAIDLWEINEAFARVVFSVRDSRSIREVNVTAAHRARPPTGGDRRDAHRNGGSTSSNARIRTTALVTRCIGVVRGSR